jgi:hypothetical protein
MGASIYSLSPPQPQSRPGKPDPGDLSNAPTFGGRGEVKASELWARPLSLDPRIGAAGRVFGDYVIMRRPWADGGHAELAA